ncbi:MAG TPA: 30S ribosomal protein S17e [Candidatus Diapherotrites archaeon]|uniref:30S ribosomal protein S17e n=1 Tax=Candidatus Iainarchaeum sp. TaxID=3101447 RepID=A0A7J4IYJ6_9ARCH|nr:30S ribosomal protein S17e [Candidatus Diapherotrites archaeon]
MGKAVPQNIKSKANVLLQTYPDQVSADFELNKKFVDSIGMPLSSTQRNLVAGFLTRKKAKAKKQ